MATLSLDDLRKDGIKDTFFRFDDGTEVAAKNIAKFLAINVGGGDKTRVNGNVVVIDRYGQKRRLIVTVNEVDLTQ